MTRKMDDGGRAKVLAAARSLFVQRGFHQATMAELSHRAEISIGQIYRLFHNKSEMVAAIIQQDTEARITRLAVIRDEVASGALTLHAAFERVVLETIEDNQGALTFEILAEGFRTPFVGDVIGKLCERYRAILSNMVISARPDMSQSRLLAAEEMLLALFFGLGNRSLSRPALGQQETARYAADMIVAMLD